MKTGHEYVFNITNYFEKDLQQFTNEEQESIVSQINYLTEQFDKSPSNYKSFIENSHVFSKLPFNYTSSLHVFRLRDETRLFATFENDPIFNQIIVTLLGCLHHYENYTKKLSELNEFLYDSKGLLMKSEGNNE